MALENIENIPPDHNYGIWDENLDGTEQNDETPPRKRRRSKEKKISDKIYGLSNLYRFDLTQKNTLLQHGIRNYSGVILSVYWRQDKLQKWWSAGLKLAELFLVKHQQGI